MRPKKRYVLFTKFPKNLPKEAEFLFQDRHGYIYRIPNEKVDSVRAEAALISGSVRVLKNTETKGRATYVSSKTN